VHVPKDSPLKLPKEYRGFEVVRVEVDRQLGTAPPSGGAATSADLDEFARKVEVRIEQLVEQVQSERKETLKGINRELGMGLEELRSRVGKLEAAASSKSK
jgi:hypothetical protein